jgi:hypothetical protein
MRRREFIAGIACAATWPAAAHAQDASPVIGYLAAGTPATNRETVAATLRGLAEAGYVEGRNLRVEYRWAESQLDRLPVLADDLVRRRVAVIVKQPPTASRLFFSVAPTRSMLGSLRASTGPAAISRVSPSSMLCWLRKGSNCCTKSRPP